jgi:hypothetical protein
MDDILCDKKMSFEDCEMILLRNAIDETEEIQKNIEYTEDVKNMIDILKKFMIERNVICYGGTAINELLPPEAQFYNKNDIPDFDFFSKRPLEDAKMLCDVFQKEGFEHIQAKSGTHFGTFKVFVNFIPIADITFLEPEIFDTLQTESIVVNRITYASPNYLRMGMFLELSRPAGETSRWEKVFTRLKLMNQYYPLVFNKGCAKTIETSAIPANIFHIVFDALVTDDVVFFGGDVLHLYAKTAAESRVSSISPSLPFDVLSIEFERTSELIVDTLREHLKGTHIIAKRNKPIGEIIPENIVIYVNKKPIACIYKPIACYGFNTITIKDSHSFPRSVKIASIPTILSLYLAFMYVNSPLYNKDRLLCLASILLDIEQKKGVKKGILQKFTVDCYGNRELSLNELKMLRNKKYNELRSQKQSKEYRWRFLDYKPDKIQHNKHRNTFFYKRQHKQRNTFRKKDDSYLVGKYTRKQNNSSNNLIQF